MMDDESLQQLYVWVDSVPLSRPKRNIARDFSDGGACVPCRRRDARAYAMEPRD